MNWNYRVMRHRNKVKAGKRTETVYWYGLHEVYYTDKKPDAWTTEPKGVIHQNDHDERNDKKGADGVIEILERMLKDAKLSRNDVLNFDKKPK